MAGTVSFMAPPVGHALLRATQNGALLWVLKGVSCL
jgi:hypothetical protein